VCVDVCACVGMCIYIYNMYVCVYSYICMYVGIPVYVCTCGVRVWIHVWVYYVCVDSPSSLYLVASYNDTDPFGEIRTRYRRLEFVLVVNPIQWQFEDQSMRWSRDSYRFMQLRPDGDSISKLCHFMWVFVSMSFSYLSLPVVHTCYLFYFIWLSDVFDQYDYPYYCIWC